MNEKIFIMDFLKLLMRVFDDMDGYMENMLNLSKKYEKEFEFFKNVDVENIEGFDTLLKDFSEEKIPILMKIFTNLVEFESKYKPTLEEKQKEAVDLRKLIKDMSNSLHKIMDDEK